MRKEYKVVLLRRKDNQRATTRSCEPHTHGPGYIEGHKSKEADRRLGVVGVPHECGCPFQQGLELAVVHRVGVHGEHPWPKTEGEQLHEVVPTSAAARKGVVQAVMVHAEHPVFSTS